MISARGIVNLVTAAVTLSQIASSAAAQDKITLGFSASTAFSNAFVAANEGIFKAHGIDVDMKLVPNSSTTPAALIADSLQIATPTAPITLQAIEQGLDLVVLAGGSYYTKGIEDVAIMVRPDSPIKTAKDFVGKRVATAGLNAFLHVLFRKWLMENGVDYKTVTFTETPFAQQIDVLRSGQVDGILAVQPFLARALETNVGRVVAYYIADLEGETLAGWYVATRAWAKGHASQAAGFRAAIAEATALLQKDPGVVRKANLVYIPFPAEVQAKFPDTRYRAEVAPEVVEKWNKIALEQAMLKKPLDPKKVLYAP
jgi:NitT/TauT family transport system substrate-binding protein